MKKGVRDSRIFEAGKYEEFHRIVKENKVSYIKYIANFHGAWTKFNIKFKLQILISQIQ